METFWSEIHYFGVKLPRDSSSTCLHGNTNVAKAFKAEVPLTRRTLKSNTIRLSTTFLGTALCIVGREPTVDPIWGPEQCQDIVEQGGYDSTHEV